MRYRVRTPEGELEYETLLHVEQAYVAGLVAPEDEVLEEGGTLWRKAGTLPALVKAQRPKARLAERNQLLSILLVVGMGVAALYLAYTGRGWFALLLSVGIISLLWRITFTAFRPKRG